MLTKPKGKRTYGQWMTNTVWMNIKNYVQHKDREGLADYLYRAMCYTIAQTKGSDWSDPDRYICVDDVPVLGVECPHCGEISSINLRKIAQKEAQKVMTGKSHSEILQEKIEQLAKEWNKQSSKKVPYEFIEWMKEKI